MIINRTDFSGTVEKIGITESGAKKLLVSQNVAGKFKTDIVVICLGSANDKASSLSLKEGSEVLIVSATLYQKNGKLTCRITGKDQIFDVTTAKENLDGGIEEVDNFI